MQIPAFVAFSRAVWCMLHPSWLIKHILMCLAMNDSLVRDWSVFSASCLVFQGVNIQAELALQLSVGAALKLSCKSFLSTERIKYHQGQNVWLTGMCKIQAEPSLVFNLVPGQDLSSSIPSESHTWSPGSLLAVSPPQVVIWGQIQNLGFPVFVASESSILPTPVLSPVAIKIRKKLG